MLFAEMHKFDMASRLSYKQIFWKQICTSNYDRNQGKTSYKFCYFLTKYKIANNAIDEQINLIDVNTKGSLR